MEDTYYSWFWRKQGYLGWWNTLISDTFWSKIFSLLTGDFLTSSKPFFSVTHVFNTLKQFPTSKNGYIISASRINIIKMIKSVLTKYVNKLKIMNLTELRTSLFLPCPAYIRSSSDLWETNLLTRSLRQAIFITLVLYQAFWDLLYNDPGKRRTFWYSYYYYLFAIIVILYYIIIRD